MPSCKNREPVNSLWIGSRVSKLEELCMRSFMAHGHPFHLYVYDDIEGIPEGVHLKDGNEIIPRASIISYPCKKLSARSDWFRFVLIACQGGWWADMDTVCLKPLDFSQEIIAMESSTSVFRFPGNHPLPKGLAFHAENPDVIAPWNTWSHTVRKFWRRNVGWPSLPYEPRECAGPKTYSRALIHFGLGDFILCDEIFTSFREGDDFLKFFQPDPSACAIMENAYCIHAYNDMAHRNGIDKDGVFDETSPFEVLKRRYDIGPK